MLTMEPSPSGVLFGNVTAAAGEIVVFSGWNEKIWSEKTPPAGNGMTLTGTIDIVMSGARFGRSNVSTVPIDMSRAAPGNVGLVSVTGAVNVRLPPGFAFDIAVTSTACAMSISGMTKMPMAVSPTIDTGRPITIRG